MHKKRSKYTNSRIAELKRFFKLTTVFDWINQNNWYNQPNFINKKKKNKKFGCLYNSHILWLNQPKFG